MKRTIRVLFSVLLGYMLGFVAGGAEGAIFGAVAAPIMAEFAQVPAFTLNDGLAKVTLKAMLEQRGQLVKDMEKITNDAEAEKRDLTEDEEGTFDAKRSELEALDKKIERKKFLEEQKRSAAAAAGQELGDGEKKELKNYSFVRAIRGQLGGNLDGFELEMHQESEKEAKRSGMTIEGVGVPAAIMASKQENRDLTVGTATAGGHTVATELQGLIPALRPNLLVESMGARMLTGLVGDVDIPRNNGVGTAEWEGEQDDAAETTQSFDKISLSPNRLAAFTHYSKKLLAQSSIGVENFVREDLEMAIKIAVDAAAINGSGSGSVPAGVLQTADIGSVAIGTNGGTPTYGKIIDLETAVNADNALMGTLGYISTPQMKGVFKQTKIDAGSGRFIMAQDSNELNGYRAGFSTQVPSDLTKGTADSICHAIIFGNWNDLIVANWAGLDIVVNPYTQAKKATVEVIVNSFWDIAVRHPESFAAIKDATLS
ncbi:phage major capsid protein [Roseivirga pacifica]|uniref:phage major capsid protein n=1 Tax=Roseivirga pacifica TaxID=1267423 RepID=UPI0020953229|nr:phage major capsid protein [Roseivirga pacifica]MCO6358554.1 phage major capsid protein [Roseivirga pacifica]MCO6369109.1 phage major capsid protein [Roseivirga pacifica]MCO6372187.1 phage major capsid protein [Roseivirga pacifica]MCO6374285.1 phage major capsid protein [Roseivirga pacifica]MCO6380918.1 phage major capsid protein [Roseivirga pacifica]